MNAVFRYIDDNWGRAVALLERLTRQPSVSAAGCGLAEMTQLVVQVFEEYGYRTQLLPAAGSPPMVYADLGTESGPTVLFYSHSDVQPADPLGLWESPPFEPTVREGFLYARGASDDKGDLVVRLEALAALRTGGRLPITPKFLIEGDEELGSPHLETVVRDNAELLAADLVLMEAESYSASGEAAMCVGAKGLLYVELEARGAAGDAHSKYAAVLPSPAWRLTWALATIKGPDGRVRIPGFYDDLRPWTENELALLRGIPDESGDLREALGVSGFVEGLEGQAWQAALYGAPTCNISGVHSGYDGPALKTVLPAMARAKLDFRLQPDQRPQDILAKLRRHLDEQGFSDIEVKAVSAHARPARSNVDHPYVRIMAAAMREFYGGEPVIIPTSAGGAAYAFAENLGVPVIQPPGGAGYAGSNIHAPNEHVRLDDLRRSIHFTALALARLGEASRPS